MNLLISLSRTSLINNVIKVILCSFARPASLTLQPHTKEELYPRENGTGNYLTAHNYDSSDLTAQSALPRSHLLPVNSMYYPDGQSGYLSYQNAYIPSVVYYDINGFPVTQPFQANLHYIQAINTSSPNHNNQFAQTEANGVFYLPCQFVNVSYQQPQGYLTVLNQVIPAVMKFPPSIQPNQVPINSENTDLPQLASLNINTEDQSLGNIPHQGQLPRKQDQIKNSQQSSKDPRKELRNLDNEHQVDLSHQPHFSEEKTNDFSSSPYKHLASENPLVKNKQKTERLAHCSKPSFLRKQSDLKEKKNDEIEKSHDTKIEHRDRSEVEVDVKVEIEQGASSYKFVHNHRWPKEKDCFTKSTKVLTPPVNHQKRTSWSQVDIFNYPRTERLQRESILKQKTWTLQNAEYDEDPDLIASAPYFDRRAVVWHSGKRFKSKLVLIMRNRLRFFGLSEDLTLVKKIVKTILGQFKDNLKDASILIVYLCFVQKGLNKFTEDTDIDCDTDLLACDELRLPYSYPSLNKAIEKWQSFNFTFERLPEAYAFLMRTFKELYFNPEYFGSPELLRVYKIFIYNQLKFLFFDEYAYPCTDEADVKN